MARNTPFHTQPASMAILASIVLAVSLGLWPTLMQEGGRGYFTFEHLPLLLVIGLLYLFMRRLRLHVFIPLMSLANQAKYITIYKDYSLRLNLPKARQSPQEVSALAEALNGMLEEIQHRETKLLQKTTELERARIQAEAANVAKSQFMSNISHELRTPLNAIIGFSSMMKEEQFGPISDKYREYLSDILRSSQNLLTIINDILDLSKAESSKLSIQYTSFQLIKIIEKAQNMLEERAMEGKVQIEITSPTPKARIVADRVRMLQILLNLLSNAVKFSPPGEKILIHYEVEPVNDEISYVTIEVSDQGIGMTPDEIATALGHFNQVDAGHDRRYEGTGLGLTLTKKLVELHAGNLRIESEKGKGTRVKVKFISNASLLD